MTSETIAAMVQRLLTGGSLLTRELSPGPFNEAGFEAGKRWAAECAQVADLRTLETVTDAETSEELAKVLKGAFGHRSALLGRDFKAMFLRGALEAWAEARAFARSNGHTLR